MTQLLGRFTAPGPHLHMPGASFLAAALLTGMAGVTYWAVTRETPDRFEVFGAKTVDLPGPTSEL